MIDKHKTSRTPFEYPARGLKQITAVVNNARLINALEETAEKEKVQICQARPHTPDIIAMSGNLRIVDRKYLGQESWNDFCEYLRQTNQEMAYPLLDNQGEILIDESYVDDTPLLIVDNLEKENHNFSDLENVLGKVYYINQKSTELITACVRKILRNSIPECGMVKAIPEDKADRSLE